MNKSEENIFTFSNTQKLPDGKLASGLSTQLPYGQNGQTESKNILSSYEHFVVSDECRIHNTVCSATLFDFHARQAIRVGLR